MERASVEGFFDINNTLHEFAVDLGASEHLDAVVLDRKGHDVAVEGDVEAFLQEPHNREESSLDASNVHNVIQGQQSVAMGSGLNPSFDFAFAENLEVHFVITKNNCSRLCEHDIRPMFEIRSIGGHVVSGT